MGRVAAGHGPATPTGGWRGETGRTLIGEFSPIALTTFVATVLLGSIRGWQELASFSDLWTTAYGQVLSLKVALVLAMVPLSVLAWRRQQAHPRIEAFLALGAVLAAGVLAAFPVPPGRAGDEVTNLTPASHGLPQPGDLTLAREAGTTVVGLSIRPAEPGINDLYVHLVPLRGADEAGGIDVTLAVDGNEPVPMRTCGTACRTAIAPLDGGERLVLALSGDASGTAAFLLPRLPAPDGTALAQALTERMQQVDTLRYDEVFGPIDPPTSRPGRSSPRPGSTV